MRSLRFTRITCHRYLYLIGETFPTRIIRIRIRLQNNWNGKVAFRIQLHRIRNKRYGPISPISPVTATGNGICQRNILNCRPVYALTLPVTSTVSPKQKASSTGLKVISKVGRL